jgi:ketosteroid isomerase-like protein
MSELEEIDLKYEKELVAQLIDKWLEGWSRKDIDVILRHVAKDFVGQSPMPNWLKITGPEGLKEYFLESYVKAPLGPVTHAESHIDVSASGDLAYEIGRHDHLVTEESGNTHVSPWNHLIVLKKIEGEWKIIAISETKSESQ